MMRWNFQTGRSCSLLTCFRSGSDSAPASGTTRYRNRLNLANDDILKNVHAVQEGNEIEKVAVLQGREFSIEMETGTGKTYAYLRTILS
jgi:restriction endonuclease